MSSISNSDSGSDSGSSSSHEDEGSGSGHARCCHDHGDEDEDKGKVSIRFTVEGAPRAELKLVCYEGETLSESIASFADMVGPLALEEWDFTATNRGLPVEEAVDDLNLDYCEHDDLAVRAAYGGVHLPAGAVGKWLLGAAEPKLPRAGRELVGKVFFNFLPQILELALGDRLLDTSRAALVSKAWAKATRNWVGEWVASPDRRFLKRMGLEEHLKTPAEAAAAFALIAACERPPRAAAARMHVWAETSLVWDEEDEEEYQNYRAFSPTPMRFRGLPDYTFVLRENSEFREGMLRPRFEEFSIFLMADNGDGGGGGGADTDSLCFRKLFCCNSMIKPARLALEDFLALRAALRERFPGVIHLPDHRLLFLLLYLCVPGPSFPGSSGRPIIKPTQRRLEKYYPEYLSLRLMPGHPDRGDGLHNQDELAVMGKRFGVNFHVPCDHYTTLGAVGADVGRYVGLSLPLSMHSQADDAMEALASFYRSSGAQPQQQAAATAAAAATQQQQQQQG